MPNRCCKFEELTGLLLLMLLSTWLALLWPWSAHGQSRWSIPIPGDISQDDAVDYRDVFLLQANWEREEPLGDTFVARLPGGVTMEFVRIPAGSFLMGSSDDATWSWNFPAEQPVHWVDIDYDFYMGKYEVTQAQWNTLMPSNPSFFNMYGGNYPVEQVTWKECQQFIQELNRLGQGHFRLPSEAEWEYACRAGSTTRFFFGESNCPATECCRLCDLGAYAWYCGNNKPYSTKPVGQKLPNPWGLYDIEGNVREFCQDSWHDSFFGAPTDGSAWEKPGEIRRVIKGGYWRSCIRGCRSSRREGTLDTNRYYGIGLRLVWTP